MSVAASVRRAEVLSSPAEALAAARAYAASIAGGVIERDRAGTVPYAELAALDASGLLGITVPAAHGGPDLSPVVVAEVIRTIAAVDPAIAQVPQAHFLFVDVLAVHGSAGQQARLFADVLAGARLGNGLAERGGQHAQDLKTRLRPVTERGGLRLFALAGASAADERHGLSRHWRNARTHASHDPVDWKYHHVGNFLLNHALPPNHGQL